MSGVIRGEGRKCWWRRESWLPEPTQVPGARATSPRLPRKPNVTFVLVLRGTKRKLRASQESSVRRTRKGSSEAAAREQDADVCQMLAGTVWSVGRASRTCLHFQGPPHEPRGNGVCADPGPKSKKAPRSV